MTSLLSAPAAQQLAGATFGLEARHEGVLTVRLNRPEVLNAFSQQTCDEFALLWRWVRDDDRVRVVVLEAEGDRAFSTGIDMREGGRLSDNVWSRQDIGFLLGPKHQRVWKPFVCAVQGMAAGGAFYWLNEADIIICSNDATFFDPHVTYGMVSGAEAAGLARRVPLGEVLRWALMGLDERIGAERALAIGLVTEVVDAADLSARAHAIAATIAAKPAAAIQGTVRAIWESLDQQREQGMEHGFFCTQVGNPIGTAGVDRASVARPQPRVR